MNIEQRLAGLLVRHSDAIHIGFEVNAAYLCAILEQMRSKEPLSDEQVVDAMKKGAPLYTDTMKKLARVEEAGDPAQPSPQTSAP
jgi:hypothetical protein